MPLDIETHIARLLDRMLVPGQPDSEIASIKEQIKYLQDLKEKEK